MTKYHVGRNGPSVCRAGVGKCPFRDYSSMEEAEDAFEREMGGIITRSVRRGLYDSSLPKTLLRTLPLKEMGAASLTVALKQECLLAGFSEEKVDSAISLAAVLHERQRRQDRMGEYSGILSTRLGIVCF